MARNGAKVVPLWRHYRCGMRRPPGEDSDERRGSRPAGPVHAARRGPLRPAERHDPAARDPPGEPAALPRRPRGLGRHRLRRGPAAPGRRQVQLPPGHRRPAHAVRGPRHARADGAVPADPRRVHRHGPAGPHPVAAQAHRGVHGEADAGAGGACRRRGRTAARRDGPPDAAGRPRRGVRAAGAVPGDLRAARRPVRRPGRLPGRLGQVPGQGPAVGGEDGGLHGVDRLPGRPGHAQARRTRRRHPVRPRP